MRSVFQNAMDAWLKRWLPTGEEHLSNVITTVRGENRIQLRSIIQDLWQFRLLLWVFCNRDLKARYTQTVLGLAWVIFTPLITVGVFTIVFGLMVKVPTDGIPTVLFYMVAVIPWYAFINVINPTVQMVEGNMSLITKVYFPRLLIAGSYAVGAIVDFLVAYVALITVFAIAMGYWHIQLLVLMPFLLLSQIAIGVGVGLFLAPLNAKYRDVKHFVPLALQLFYYSTPAIYPVSAVPPWAEPWFDVNPLSIVITSYRGALLGEWPTVQSMLTLTTIAVVTLAIGTFFFLRNDKRLVDVI